MTIFSKKQPKIPEKLNKIPEILNDLQKKIKKMAFFAKKKNKKKI